MTPAMARRIALDWAVDCARRVTKSWFVVPPHDDHTPTVVVPMTERAAYLTELGGAGAPEVLSLVDTGGSGWPERRGTLTALAEDLQRGRTSQVSLEPWPTWDGKPTAALPGLPRRRDVLGGLAHRPPGLPRSQQLHARWSRPTPSTSRSSSRG